MKCRCPTCRKVFAAPDDRPATTDKFYPFCSERCKWVDLGAWLKGEYRILSKPQAEDPEASERGF